jgi:hypothetical protein
MTNSQFLAAQSGVVVTFDDIHTPYFDGMNQEPVYKSNSVELRVVEAMGPPGDYNGDGTVDAADYALWRSDPSSYGGGQGYTDWVNNFGQAAGGGSGSSANAAVPEPASALLLILGAAFGFFRGRRVASRAPTTR